jgi:hypothetical protein
MLVGDLYICYERRALMGKKIFLLILFLIGTYFVFNTDTGIHVVILISISLSFYFIFHLFSRKKKWIKYIPAAIVSIIVAIAWYDHSTISSRAVSDGTFLASALILVALIIILIPLILIPITLDAWSIIKQRRIK